jgi:hypothetical protein
MSAINNAIKKKNLQAIKELNVLIDKLVDFVADKD